MQRNPQRRTQMYDNAGMTRLHPAATVAPAEGEGPAVRGGIGEPRTVLGAKM